MATNRNIKSLIVKNRSTRREQAGFVEALDPLIKSSTINSLLLSDVSNKLDAISDNTKSFGLIGETIKTLVGVMGSFVDIFSKDIEQRKTSDFFAGALAKEKEYENKLKTGIDSTSTTSPTKALSSKEESGFLGTLLKWIGGLLLTGGIGTWLWKNEGFREKVTGFIGKLFEGISEGAQSFYTFAKDWINDENNRATISNFFAGLLNAIAKGFELVGDLGKVLVEEYKREGSPLRNTINTIIESIWGFVKEHPVVSLGAALIAFSDKLSLMVVSLYAAVKTISAITSTISAIASHPLLLVAGGIGGLTWWLNDNRQKEIDAPLLDEEKAKQKELHDKLKKLETTNPELVKEFNDQVRDAVDNAKENTTVYNKKEAEERLKYATEQKIFNGMFSPIGKKINKALGNIPAIEAQAIAAPAQPKLAQPEQQSTTTQENIPTPITNTNLNFDRGSFSTELYNRLNPTEEDFSETKPTATNGPTVSAASQIESTTPQAQSNTTEESTTPTEEKGKIKKTGNAGADLITKLLDEKNITDENLRNAIFALASVESSFNPNARGPIIDDPTSVHYGKRAHGLFQIMPATAKEMGYSESDIKDPEKAAKAGLEYFLQNYKQFGNVDKAIVAHHAGPGASIRWEKTGKLTGGSKYITNAAYLQKIKSRMGKTDDLISNSLQTQGKVGDSLSPDQKTITPNDSFEVFSPEWLENLINNVTKTSVGIEQLRALSPGLINAPKVSGEELNKALREVSSEQNKAPDVVVNAPTVNNSTSTGQNENKEVQMASIFDNEFIEQLLNRTVNIFNFSGFNT